MSIPVFRVTVPEYKLKTFEDPSEKMDYAGTPWYNIQIPKVYWDNRPDFQSIGAQIDVCFKKHFLGKNVAVRTLSSEEHPGKSRSELIEIIQEIGHDRYDPNRKGDRYENIDNLSIDFFAIDFKVEEQDVYFEHFIEPFYFWPVSDGKKPVRLDVAIVFDLSKLKRVEHRYEGRENEIKRDGFVFREPDNKPGAVLGIIEIG
ncbi:MAG: hypothetical protein DWQ02_05840 [Bacteroidetes bacterium]|nr:MAG: hypothetical protein DWQ02_05840 [Bacteroidota bacterium]